MSQTESKLKLKCFKCRSDIELLTDENTLDRFIIYCPYCEYSLYPCYRFDRQDIVNWWNDHK